MAKDKGDVRAAIKKVIQDETKAFWNKDYRMLSRFWVHAGYVQHDERLVSGGVKVLKGWGPISKAFKQYIAANPEPNPVASNAKRKDFTVRVGKDMAWVTYVQHEIDSGEPGMNKQGVARETKILEKHDGSWKIVYVGIVPVSTP
jgi:hypothetical protein